MEELKIQPLAQAHAQHGGADKFDKRTEQRITSVGNGYSNNNTKKPKFISFSNNRSGHAEQLTTKSFLMMSRNSLDQNLDDHGESNGSSSTRCPEFISFFVNNRSGHFEQFTIALEMIQGILDR